MDSVPSFLHITPLCCNKSTFCIAIPSFSHCFFKKMQIYIYIFVYILPIAEFMKKKQTDAKSVPDICIFPPDWPISFISLLLTFCLGEEGHRACTTFLVGI